MALNIFIINENVFKMTHKKLFDDKRQQTSKVNFLATENEFFLDENNYHPFTSSKGIYVKNGRKESRRQKGASKKGHFIA